MYFITGLIIFALCCLLTQMLFVDSEIARAKFCLPIPVTSVFMVGWTLLLAGCGKVPTFGENKVFINRLAIEIGEPLPEQGLEDVQHVLLALFGTADQPVLPESLLPGILTLDNVKRAAGKVYSDEQDVHFGLYRNNCIRCHGASGDGHGPAARLLSPYPRDYRLGKFKFKSTEQGVKPTKEDLSRTILHGIPGTSMPSFSLLPAEDIDALTDYVIYLSVRGETQRELLRMVSHKLDYGRGDRLLDSNWQQSDPSRYEQQLGELSKVAVDFFEQWRVDSPPPPIRPISMPIWEESSVDVSKRSGQLTDSIARGRQLFRSSVASCSKCHGEDGSGSNAPRDFDLWTKDWSISAGLDPENRMQIKPMLAAGALKPERLYPRNLQHGVFRGGSRPEDIYLRITRGIEGTSMPAAAMQPQVPQGLTSDQIWDLVNYVLSLASGSAAIISGDSAP